MGASRYGTPRHDALDFREIVGIKEGASKKKTRKRPLDVLAKSTDDAALGMSGAVLCWWTGSVPFQ